MRKFRLLALLLVMPGFSSVHAQEGKQEDPQKAGEKVPATLAEAHVALERVLSAEDLAKIDAMETEDEVLRFHRGLGGWIRNAWGLWNGSPLRDHLKALGFTHPDDMSSVILKTFWCKRHGKDFRLKERAEYYAAYWEAQRKASHKARFFTTSDGLPGDPVIALARLGDDIWIGSAGKGLCALSRTTLKTRCVALPGDWWAALAYPVQPDRRGDTLWFGVNDGVPAMHADYISGPPVGGDKPGGLCLYDPATDRKFYHTPKEGLHSSRVYSLLVEEDAVWVWGLYPMVSWEKEGLSKHDRKKGEWNFIPLDFGYRCFSGEYPPSLLASTGKEIWFGQSCMDKESGKWTSLSDKTGRENGAVTSVAADGRVVWIGFLGGAAVRLDVDKGESVRMEKLGTGGAVTCFAFDEKHVFVGGAGATPDGKPSGGWLLAADKQGSNWFDLGSEAGLSGAEIRVLLPDGDVLWAGTERGLARIVLWSWK
jgi:hypothetical protein